MILFETEFGSRFSRLTKMNSIDIYNAHLKMRHASRDYNGNVSYKRNGGKILLLFDVHCCYHNYHFYIYLEHSRDEVLAIRLKFPNKIPVGLCKLYYYNNRALIRTSN